MERTWKVIIADDEPIIRDGIRQSVDWQRLGLRVVAEAEDGEEALILAVEHAIHILLIDLNMPIMNGMTVIGRIREELPACKIIIITGHDEFAYAQDAIRLGVDDYILKPVNPNQLADVLKKITNQLLSLQKNEEHLLIASKQIEKNFSLLRERFCLEWIDGQLSEGEIVEQLAFLNMPVRAPAMVGVIRWSGSSKGKELLSEKDRQLYLFATENIVEEILSPYTFVKFRDPMGMLVVLIWNELKEDIFTEIEQLVLTYLKISVISELNPNMAGLIGVSAVYQTTKTAVYKETRLSPFVRSAKEMITDRFGDPNLTLEEVAQELKVSTVYLSRIFKQESGVSFVSLLTHIRMKNAIHLLTTSDMTMSEIAERVGYDSQHYFSTAFKKVIGVPPNQYRKEGNGR